VSYAWGKAMSPNENSSWTPNVQALGRIIGGWQTS
jgi:hypothetical protein